MSFGDAIKSVFSKYATFGGRARRSEYWYFVLFNFLVSFVLSMLAKSASFFNIIDVIFSLAVLIPGLAVSCRRLHDIGKSGWYILLGLIPLVGAIILIVWACKDSDPGENAFGPNPKDVTIVAEQ